MILSSTDILGILQRSAIISGSARIFVVDGRPVLSGKEGLFIHIERFPSVEEFEATWRIWIESDGSEPEDLVIEEMKRLLPGFRIRPGLLIEASVTDFKSSNTEVKPKAPVSEPSIDITKEIEKRFADLTEEIQDRMLLVNSGQAGSDGKDGSQGPAGPAGSDGKDLLASDATLDDLADVEIANTIPLKKNQVLTYDGSRWTNLHIPQLTSSSSSGGGGSSASGIEEAPQDGDYYVRQSGLWVDLASAMEDIASRASDGGNLETGTSTGNGSIVDGGNLETGTSTGTNATVNAEAIT